MTSGQDAFTNLDPQDILVIGSLVSDISCTYVRRPDDDDIARPRQGSSNPARITQCVGGVAHNIALASDYMGASVLLVSVVAEDSAGAYLLRELEEEGLRTEGVLQLGSSEEHGEIRTGQYVGNYNHDGEFLFGMADVKLMEHPGTEVETTWSTLFTKTHPKVVVLDTTFSLKTIDIITKLALKHEASVIIEPVSQPRAKDFALTQSFRETQLPGSQARVDMITPNAEELDALFQGAVSAGTFEQAAVEEAMSSEANWLSLIPTAAVAMQGLFKSRLYKIVLLLRYVPVIIVTFGVDGCLLAVCRDPNVTNEAIPATCGVISCERSTGSIHGMFEYFPSPYRLEGSGVVSVNGAGDSLVGAVAVEWLKVMKGHAAGDGSRGYISIAWSHWQHILNRGQWAAMATVQHEATVSPAIQDLDGYKDEFLQQRSHSRSAR